MNDIYEAVIGLEVHVELKTATKIFCGCPTGFGADPNTQVCPVCMGLPGTLPVLNKRAVKFAIRAGLATGCEIARNTRFDRKNYFYPDLPKAYQISQYEFPICEHGGIDIKTDTGTKHIGITRIHLEEDAGKLIHNDGKTLIDYNRAGVPLIEIVSEPDIRSADEARAYLAELRTLLLYTDISDCRMEEGSMRCDVNLSVRKRGDTALGVRTEMKNINSFAFVAKAIEYEFARQVKVLEGGGAVVAETRRFDSSTGQTYTMRLKESADDYRFFPEPDLAPLKISDALIESVRASLPKMPAERRAEYTQRYGITEADAALIVSRPELANYFEAAASLTSYPRIAANILLSELLALTSQDSPALPITPPYLAEIATLFGNGDINSATVKKLIKLCSAPDALCPRETVSTHGLYQINDRDTLTTVLNEVLSSNPKLLSDYRSGKLAAKKAIIGKIMSSTSALANPVVLNEIFEEIV